MFLPSNPTSYAFSIAFSVFSIGPLFPCLIKTIPLVAPVAYPAMVSPSRSVYGSLSKMPLSL